MLYYIQNDVIKEVKNANYLGVLLTIVYHIMSILTTLHITIERLVMLNVFSSETSVNAPLISKAIAIRA